MKVGSAGSTLHIIDLHFMFGIIVENIVSLIVDNLWPKVFVRFRLRFIFRFTALDIIGDKQIS